MKKIFLSILVAIIPIYVNAEDKYYTSFYEKELSSSNYYEETESLKREEIKLYNTYVLERKNLGYLEENDKYIKDENNYIIETKYLDSKNENTDYQNIYFKVDKNPNIISLYMKDLIVSNSVRIYDISIYNNGIRIYNGSTKNLIDNPIIQFRFGNYYNLQNLTMIIEINDNGLNNFNGTIMAYDGEEEINNEFSIKRYSKNDIFKIIFQKPEDYYKLSQNIPWYKDTDKNISFFPYEYKKYNYYTYERKYLNKYTNIQSDEYQIDYEDFKTKYNYYERYYITLKDEIEDINNLSSLIIDTNMKSKDINIDLRETTNNYIISFKYKNDKIVKVFPKKEEEKEINNIEDYQIKDENLLEDSKKEEKNIIKNVKNKTVNKNINNVNKLTNENNNPTEKVENKPKNNEEKQKFKNIVDKKEIEIICLLVIFTIISLHKKYLNKK